MTDSEAPTHGTPRMEEHARRLGDGSATFLERLGLSRLAGGVLLILLGVLVLVMPELIAWFVGVGAIVLGVLVLAYTPTSRPS